MLTLKYLCNVLVNLPYKIITTGLIHCYHAPYCATPILVITSYKALGENI